MTINEKIELWYEAGNVSWWFNRSEAQAIIFGTMGFPTWADFIIEYDDSHVEILLERVAEKGRLKEPREKTPKERVLDALFQQYEDLRDDYYSMSKDKLFHAAADVALLTEAYQKLEIILFEKDITEEQAALWERGNLLEKISRTLSKELLDLVDSVQLWDTYLAHLAADSHSHKSTRRGGGSR